MTTVNDAVPHLTKHRPTIWIAFPAVQARPMTSSGLRMVRFVSSSLLALTVLSAAGLALAQSAPSIGGVGWSALHCEGAPAPDAALLRVTVAGGTEQDHQFTCAAARRALEFFLGHGLVPTSRLRIEFREAVFLDLSGCMDAAGLGPAPCDSAVTAGAFNAGRVPGEFSHAERVVGAFHPGSETALVTTEASPWLRAHTYFGLAMNEEMFMSILTHEITHALSKSLYSPALRGVDLDLHVQEEYVAYVAQLSTMSPDLRSAVLARFPASAHRFNDETDINALSLGLSPEAFGVMSYRHFISDAGGLDFLHRIYCGEYRPPFLY